MDCQITDSHCQSAQPKLQATSFQFTGLKYKVAASPRSKGTAADNNIKQNSKPNYDLQDVNLDERFSSIDKNGEDQQYAKDGVVALRPEHAGKLNKSKVMKAKSFVITKESLLALPKKVVPNKDLEKSKKVRRRLKSTINFDRQSINLLIKDKNIFENKKIIKKACNISQKSSTTLVGIWDQ